MHKVSIIIPCYNSEKYISETINSALTQTWQNKEIIIIDDGSTDKSYEVAKKYESNIVKVYRQINSGACRARNYGFELSTGDYIQYLDADDLISQNLLEKKVSLFKYYGDEIIVTSKLKMFLETILDSNFLSVGLYKNYSNGIDLIIDMSRKWQPFQVSAWMIPRTLQINAGSWNETLLRNQDGEMLIRLLLKSKKVIFCNEAISYYRNTNSSLSKSGSYNSFLSLYNSYYLYEEKILNFENSSRTRRTMALYYSSLIYLNNNKYPKIAKFAGDRIKSLKQKPQLGGNKFIQLFSKLIGFKNTISLIYFIKKRIRC